MSKTTQVSNILKKNSLTLHGYCRFELLSDHLLPCRALSRLNSAFLPGNPPQTVIVVLFPYKFDHQPGNLSHYARVPDYHNAAGSLLEKTAFELSQSFPEHRFISFIDNSPIPEVRAAALAGLGVVGDHGLLINPLYGSWVFIGAIVTDLPSVLPDNVIKQCSHCGACKEACPGGCAGSKSRVNCVSRISQIKGKLSAQQEALLQKSGMVWGCDFCQDVCPLNSDAAIKPHPCFGGRLYKPSLSFNDLDSLEGKAYGWRGPEVVRRNLNLQIRHKN
jgi:epoxyqueuosine reductase